MIESGGEFQQMWRTCERFLAVSSAQCSPKPDKNILASAGTLKADLTMQSDALSLTRGTLAFSGFTLHFSSIQKLWTESGLHKVTRERAIMEPKQPSLLITTVQSWWRFLNANHNTHLFQFNRNLATMGWWQRSVNKPFCQSNGLENIGYWRELFAVKRMQFKCNAFGLCF